MDPQSRRLLTAWAVGTAGVIAVAFMLRVIVHTLMQAAGAI